MTRFLKNADVTGYISQTSVTSSLLKTDSAGKLVAAVAGTDYATPGTIASADKLIREVYNKTGATLTKGTVVYINDGQGNLPAVTKAIASGDSTSAQTFGIVQADITNNNNGYVVIAGGLDNMNTQGLGVGTALYLSSTTAGEYTTVKQSAPNHLVYIGVIVRDHPTQGVIEVRIQNGYELEELHNVAIASLANNHTLVWESATSLWKNKTIAAALGYTPQPQLSGTGFVKIDGTTISYDNSTYLTTTAASSTYLPLAGGTLTGALIGTSSSFSGNITISAAATNGLILQNSSGGESPNVTFITPVNKYNIDANALGVLRFFTENTDGTGGVVRATIDSNGAGMFISSVTAASGIFNNGANSTDGIKVISTTSSSLFTGGIEFIRTTVAGGSKVQPLRDAAIGGVGFNFLVTANNTAEINATYTPALSILNTGAATFSNSVTATSFIRSGGTSAQFLKADGSVDSSTYLTSYTEADTLATVTGRGNTTATRIGVLTSAAINLAGAGNSGTWVGGVQDATTGWSISNNGIGLKADDTTYATVGIASSNGILYFGRTTAGGVGTLASWLEVNSAGVANFIRARPQHNGSNLALVSETLQLSGGTMTGIISFSNVTGNKIDFYHSTTGSGDRYGVQVQSSELRIHSGAAGADSGGITFGKSTTTTFTETMRVRNDGIVNIAGYLRTAGVTSNEVLFNAGTASVNFGNAFGQGTNNRSVYFRGNTGVSAWWGGIDANGNNIPFAAIDATAGEFSFWRNSGGTGGGTWSRIMRMNESGLTIDSGSFIGSLTGVASGNAVSRGLSNWNDSTVIGNVFGMLAWKNYGNNHVIFDASQSTSPSGASVDSTNSAVAWTATYPTLMGWNGSTTFGVRVDSSRASNLVEHRPSRTDSAWYNIIWGAGNPSHLYSADTVQIQSSTGAVRANIYYDNQDTGYYLDPNGNSILTTATFNVNASSTLTLTAAGTNASYIRAGSGDELYIGGNNSWQMRFSGANVLMDNGGYLQNNESIRSGIFYDSSDTAYYLDPNNISRIRGLSIAGNANSTSTLDQLGFWAVVDGVPNTTSAIGFKQVSGIWAEHGVTNGAYNTYFTMDSPGRGWVFRRATNGGADYTAVNVASISNTGHAQFDGSLRAPIFYDSSNTAFYLDPNDTSNLSRLIVRDAVAGASLLVGSNNVSRVHNDDARKALVINASLYPALHINAYDGGNTTHGAYIVMSGNLTSGGYRLWTMGIANQNPGIFSIGYSDMQDGNGHYGIGDAWSGSDVHHGRLIIDTSGNTKIRGMLYVNGTSGGITTGNAVIHAGNIGSQTVANTTSISSAVGGSYQWTNIQYFLTNNGGYLGSTDSAKLQAYSTGNNSAFMSFHKGGHYAVNFGLDADNVMRIGGWSAAANRWQLDMSGNQTIAGSSTATSFFESSDSRLKTLIDESAQVLGIENLQAKLYEKNGKIELGYFAQDAQELMPYSVNENTEGYLNLSYREVHTAKIARLEKELEELKAKLN